VVLNWFEDQPYRKGLHGIGRSLFIMRFFASLVLLRLFSANIVWVRHNFRPHNAGHDMKLYSSVIKWMRRVSHRVVTLEKTDLIATDVVKHPLYDTPAVNLEAMQTGRRTTPFLYFGAIKPYKRLDKLLDAWPVQQPLKIMGYCGDNTYEAELLDIIRSRKLDVTWENRFVEDDALELAIADTRYVVLPHDDNAMISSGTFYLALTLGANILCFDSRFARNKAQEFTFVQILEPTRLDTQLGSLEYTEAHKVIAAARQAYSDEQIKASWQPVLGNH